MLCYVFSIFYLTFRLGKLFFHTKYKYLRQLTLNGEQFNILKCYSENRFINYRIPGIVLDWFDTVLKAREF